MKALLLAATSSLALTGFAMAQTATTTTTTTTPAEAAASNAAAAADNAAAAAGHAVDAAADAAGDAAKAAGDAAKAAGDAAKDAATDAGNAVDKAVTDVTTTTPVTTTEAVGTSATTTAPADATMPAETTATTTAPVEAVVVAPDVGAPVMTADNPGMLASWVTSRRIWTTNQPSSSAWSDTTLTERPAEWADIAKVDDIVFDADGNLAGYVADIGGFLGIGAKSVLLGKDALHFVRIGDDAFFATNYTKEELNALPAFDTTTVMR